MTFLIMQLHNLYLYLTLYLNVSRREKTSSKLRKIICQTSMFAAPQLVPLLNTLPQRQQPTENVVDDVEKSPVGDVPLRERRRQECFFFATRHKPQNISPRSILHVRRTAQGGALLKSHSPFLYPQTLGGAIFGVVRIYTFSHHDETISNRMYTCLVW